MSIIRMGIRCSLMLLCVLWMFPGALPAQHYIPTDSRLNHLLDYYQDREGMTVHSLYTRPVKSRFFQDASDAFPEYLFSGDSLGAKGDLYVEAGEGRPSLRLYPSLAFYGAFHPAFYIGMQTIGTNDAGGMTRLGTEEAPGGITGRVQRAWIGYDTEHFEIVVGRDALQLGPGRFSNLVINGDLPPYDMFRIRMSRYGFHLYSFSTFLPRIESEYDPTEYVNRYMSGKRIAYQTRDGKLTVGVGDVIMYTGVKRVFNWALSNPFIPAYLLVHDDVRVWAPDLGDNENIQMYADAAVRFARQHTGYFEVNFDEFQVDPDDRPLRDDEIGYTLGYAGVYSLNEKFNLHLQAEFSSVRTWVYNHPGHFTQYTYKDRPIGNSEGGDLREYHIRADLWSGYRWSAGLQYSAWHQGQITLEDQWDPSLTNNRGFPYGTIEHTQALRFSTHFYTPKFRTANLFAEYRSSANYQHVEGAEHDEFRYGLNLYYYFHVN